MGRLSIALPLLSLGLSCNDANAFVICSSGRRSVIHLMGYLDSLSQNPQSSPRSSSSAEDTDDNEDDLSNTLNGKSDNTKVIAPQVDPPPMKKTDPSVVPSPIMETFSDAPPEMQLKLDEKLSADVASTVAATLGSSHSYVAAREALRDSRIRAQRRLSRSAFEKEKAAEKITRLQAQMEKEARKVEQELQAKLSETQQQIDEEVKRMSDLLQHEIELEVTRECQIVDLLGALHASVSTKEAEIASEETILSEMTEVRSNLKPGSIASQMDGLIAQKREMTEIERALMKDLEDCVSEMESILVDARTRATRMLETVEKIVGPDASEEQPYEWSDIDEMETVLEQAAENIAASEKRVMLLRDRLDDDLFIKSAALGIPAGAGSSKTARKREEPFRVMEENLELKAKLADMKNLNDAEVLGLLAESVTKATFGSSKAAILGLKAMFDGGSNDKKRT